MLHPLGMISVQIVENPHPKPIDRRIIEMEKTIADRRVGILKSGTRANTFIDHQTSTNSGDLEYHSLVSSLDTGTCTFSIGDYVALKRNPQCVTGIVRWSGRVQGENDILKAVGIEADKTVDATDKQCLNVLYAQKLFKISEGHKRLFFPESDLCNYIMKPRPSPCFCDDKDEEQFIPGALVLIEPMKKIGTIRWIGSLPGYDKTVQFAGIELASSDSSGGRNNGSFGGIRYFICQGRSEFYPVSELKTVPQQKCKNITDEEAISNELASYSGFLFKKDQENEAITKHYNQETIDGLIHQLKLKDEQISNIKQKLATHELEIEKLMKEYNLENEKFQQQLQEKEREKKHFQLQKKQQITALENRIDQLQQENIEALEKKDRTINELHNRKQYQLQWAIDREELVLSEDVLGKGGWGMVRVGKFRGTLVAIKSMHELIISPHNSELFAREMDIASRIHHPNILQFIGATKMGKLLIVTELMPTSLRKELEKPSTFIHSNPRILLMIGTDIALALNYLHLFKPHPILHRDVSSANILLEHSDNVGLLWKAKLSDYGSANLQNKINTESPGCPVYAAPEASTPSQHSPAMDIYSFGVLLLEMITKHLPSTEISEREALMSTVKWNKLKLLIECLTDRDPKSRPNAENVIKQLESLRT